MYSPRRMTWADLDLAYKSCATCGSQWRLLKKKHNFLSWENDDCRSIMNVWGKLFSNKPMSTHGQRDWWLVSNVPFGHLYNIRNVAVWQYMLNINVMLNLKQPKVTFMMINMMIIGSYVQQAEGIFIPSSWKVLECPPLGINTEGSRMKLFHCRTSGPVSIVEPWKLL